MKHVKASDIIEFSVLFLFLFLAVWFIASGIISAGGWVHNWPYPHR